MLLLLSAGAWTRIAHAMSLLTMMQRRRPLPEQHSNGAQMRNAQARPWSALLSQVHWVPNQDETTARRIQIVNADDQILSVPVEAMRGQWANLSSEPVHHRCGDVPDLSLRPTAGLSMRSLR